MASFSRKNSFFRARSANRNADGDRARVTAILRSIEEALESTKAEHEGLSSRINDVIARVAVTLGNDTDEYLTREPEDNHFQNLLGTEIANGQRRLDELAIAIGHYKFMKIDLITRFPDSQLQAGPRIPFHDKIGPVNPS